MCIDSKTKKQIKLKKNEKKTSNGQRDVTVKHTEKQPRQRSGANNSES